MHRGLVVLVLPQLRKGALIAGLLSAGCALGGGQTSAPAPSFLEKLLPSTLAAAPPPEPAKKAGCGTAAQCKSVLKKMIDDPKRGWVGQQLPPDAYTDGTRLFAYRALRKRLKCRELTLAVNEISAAAKALRGDVPGITPAQISRTRALNSQVQGQLIKERAARCKT
jgi:hypothetical protein